MILKKYWPYILIAALIGGGLTYIKVLKVERDHYKNKVISVQQELDRVVVENKQRVGTLEAAAKKQTDDFASEYQQEQLVMQKFYKERNEYYEKQLKTNKQLNAMRLDLDTVRLFNATKSNDVANPKDTTTADKGNDGSSTTTTNITGTDLFRAIKTNDENHLACIKVVESWQKFWTKYVEDVRAVQP